MKKIPRSQFPKPAVNSAVSRLLALTEAIWKEWRPRLKANTRRDDKTDDDTFDRLEETLRQALETWLDELRGSGYEAHQFLQRQFSAQFRAFYSADPMLSEPWGASEIEQMAANVMRRCRGTIGDAIGRMRQVQSRGRDRQHDPAEIDGKIGKLFSVLEQRFAFAIRDEMGDMVARTTRRRHEAFGIVDYIWRDRRDIRVRGRPDGRYPHAKHSHWHRDGLLFRYDDPPADGHPGEPDGCRCMGEPNFPAQGRRDPGWLAWLLLGAAAGAASELNKQ